MTLLRVSLRWYPTGYLKIIVEINRAASVLQYRQHPLLNHRPKSEGSTRSHAVLNRNTLCIVIWKDNSSDNHSSASCVYSYGLLSFNIALFSFFPLFNYAYLLHVLRLLFETLSYLICFIFLFFICLHYFLLFFLPLSTLFSVTIVTWNVVLLSA